MENSWHFCAFLDQNQAIDFRLKKDPVSVLYRTYRCQGLCSDLSFTCQRPAATQVELPLMPLARQSGKQPEVLEKQSPRQSHARGFQATPAAFRARRPAN